MTMDTQTDTAAETDAQALRTIGEAYCRAVHFQDIAALERIFHPNAHLYAMGSNGLEDWPRQQFLDRVAGRDGSGGLPTFEIHSVDVAGPEMGQVTLSVAVSPRRFTDYLNFLKIDGEWRVIAKVFRTAEGPAL
jgi:hypothetical protein